MRAAVTPAGPFSLAQAARVLQDFPVPAATWDGETLRVAFCLERSWEPVGAALTQQGDTVRVDTPKHARATVERIFSLDQDARPFFEKVLKRDPVLRRIAAARAGLRPVLFGSPWEAAVWSVLSQRVQMTQAARTMVRLAEAHGPAVEVDGETLHAFPCPATLLRVREFPGVAGYKVEWLLDLAHAALRGQLDTERLLGMPVDDAMRALQQLPGIGRFSAELVLIRGAGAPDVQSTAAARAQHAVERAYGPGADLATVGEKWRPYRSWGSFLLRFALDEAASGR